MPNGQSRWIVAALAAGTWGLGGCDAATVGGGSAVRVYEGTRVIRTGPFLLKGPSPQQRPNDYRPFTYPAVFIENEYFRCCVLPTVGGRLYEVYNKASRSQMFFVNPYLETHEDDYEGGHPWNLGGVEVNFPYFHHGNTYNDQWQWAAVRRADGSVGVAVGFTSRPTMQRAVFRVLLQPGAARIDLEYAFENLNPYPWGLAAWIDTMHPKTMNTQFILPVGWVAQHGYNRGRSDVLSWPVRDGVDLSWQKNVPASMSLSEFAFRPRARFHGCYDYATDRGAARVFDPRTLPAAKLWTQPPPVTPEQYYQHFEIWTATSQVMEDPGRQAELSRYTAADCWQQVWGIGGFLFANADCAVNLVRKDDGKLLAGVCAARKLPGCVVSLRCNMDTFVREGLDLDPARPWRKEMAAPAGDVTLEVLGPAGQSIARYELRAGEQPREQWKMPSQPHWRGGVNEAVYEEMYSTLWRRRGHFMDGAIDRYRTLLKASPDSTDLMLALARSYIKDAQVRVGVGYRQPGPKADEDAATRRRDNLAQAVKLLRKLVELHPQQARGHFYLGLALERQGDRVAAGECYRRALGCERPYGPAALYLARSVVKDKPAEAIPLARRAAGLYPQSSLAQHLLIAALTAGGKGAEAAALATRLLEADPTDAVTTSLLADALRASDQPDKGNLYAGETQRLLNADPASQKAHAADLAWLAGQ